MAKTNKNGKNELDAILEQLKKSYGEDSSDKISDELLETSDQDNDTELTAILENLFSNTTIENDENKETDDLIIENTVEETLVEASPIIVESAVKETLVEGSIASSEDNSDAEADVDSILDIMLNHRAKQIPSIEETVEVDEAVEVEETAEVDEAVEVEETVEVEIQVESFNAHDDISFDNEALENITEGPKELIDCANIDISGIQEPQIKFIINKSEYTFDPLQETLPCLSNRYSARLEKSDTTVTTQIQSEAPTISDKESEKFSSTDISLLLNLGYSEEVITQIGKNKTESVILENNSEFVPESNKTPYGFCGKELTERPQLVEIQEKYKSNKIHAIIRLIAAAFISLIIFSVDIYFDIFSTRADVVPILLAAEFILIALLASLMYKKLKLGAIGIIKFEATSYSLLVFMFASYALYNLISLILFWALAYETFTMLVGFCISLSAILVLIADLLNCLREASALNIIASSDKLYTTQKELAPKAAFKQSQSNISAYRLCKTELINGYFKKTASVNISSQNYIYILGIVPVISLIIGCLSLLAGENVTTCISTIMFSVVLCIPFSFIIIRSLSEYIFSYNLSKEETAFIGIDSAFEYSQATELIFEDVDAVELVSYTEIRPNKNSAETDNAFEVACAVFKALGGPLATIANSSKNSKNAAEESHEVIINDVSDRGIHLYFDSSKNILIGDQHYMRFHNIKVKTDANLTTATKGHDSAVIYIAFDQIPKLAFIVQCKIKKSFLNVADLLDTKNIRTGIKTYEPQINELFLEQNRGQNDSSINIQKPRSFEPANAKNICDGSVVSSKNRACVAKAICISTDIVAQRKVAKRLNILTALLGAFLSCLLMLFISIDTNWGLFDFIKEHTTLVLIFFLLIESIPMIVNLIKLAKTQKGSLSLKNSDKEISK